MLPENESMCVNVLLDCFRSNFECIERPVDSIATGLQIDRIFYIDFDGGILMKNNRYHRCVNHGEFIGLSYIYGLMNHEGDMINIPPTQSKILYIPPRRALKLVDEHNLHRYLGFFMASKYNRVVNSHDRKLRECTFKKIRDLIYYIDAQQVKPQISLSKIIVDTTGLSRSWVLKVISELSKGGWISLNKGILVSVNKELPNGF